jgi:hypothetical protein
MSSSSALGSMVAFSLAASRAPAPRRTTTTPPREPPPPPERHNALIHPFGPLPEVFLGTSGPTNVPEVESGALVYAHAAIEGDRLRANALLGVGCTINGLARALARRFPKRPLPPPLVGPPDFLDPAVLARAILYYNLEHLLGTDFTVVQVASLRARWLAGVRLPLPLEKDPGRVVNPWISSLAEIDRMNAAYLALPERAVLDTILDMPVERLPIPDPVELSRTALAQASPDPVAAIRDRLLANPFEPVFWIVEVLRQTGTDSDRQQRVLDVLASLSQSQIDLLGWCSAGNAVLRQFWRVVAPAAYPVVDEAYRAALTKVAQGLGIQGDPMSGFREPRRFGPDVIPQELVFTRTQRERPHPQNAQRIQIHVPLLGRDVMVGSIDSWPGAEVTYKGPAYAGELEPGRFYAEHVAEIFPADLPAAYADRMRRRAEVAIAISSNEGKLDACRAPDAGIISTGMQQWTMLADDEMTVLLQRFRDRNEAHYDLFFGMHGLQCAVDTSQRNPDYTLDPVTSRPRSLPESFPTYVKLEKVLPGQEKAPLNSASGGNAARVAFFGGTRVGSVITFSPEWCARVRMAALCSLDYNIVQIQTAAYRFTRIERGPSTFTVDGHTYGLRELFSSQFAAAALLDHHINVPGFVARSVELAVRKTTTSLPFPPRTSPEAPTSPLQREFCLRFATNYVAHRVFSLKKLSDGTRTPNYGDSRKKPRDAHILWLHDSMMDRWLEREPGSPMLMSPEPGSFAGWTPPTE